jgi:Fe-S-cluster containining protein
MLLSNSEYEVLDVTNRKRKKDYKDFFKKSNKKIVLSQLPELHEDAFTAIDCLKCANCCKNYSPRFKMPDIKRISRYLNMKERLFIDTYLLLDDEGDYVVKSNPCPFLDEQNFCSIYEYRPRDCARYPYTNEDVLYKQINLTLKNATICPAVFFVMEKLLNKTM